MTIHEIKDKIFKRYKGFIRSRGREPIGIVLSKDYYIELTRSEKPWEGSLLRAESRIYERGHPQPGDSFLGLDVAITKAEDTIIVY